MGVDFSEEQVALAHQLGLSEVSCKSVEDALSEIPDQSVDVIIAMDLFEHLDFEDLFRLFDEINRVLRPEGRIVASVPNAEGLYGMRILFGDITHYTAFTPQSVSQMLYVVGFSDIVCYESKPTVHGFKSLLRRIIWEIGTFPHRLLLIAETGSTHFVLSQSMVFTALKK